MVELAPRLCPVCDCPFDSKDTWFEVGECVYWHTAAKQKCIKRADGTTESIPVIIPHVPAPNDQWPYKGL